MNFSLLKKMLPGLLPLVVFILADEIWGIMVGLYVALCFGISELAFFYIKDRKIERFILVDTGLLVVLGVISIVLENDIFFKIKPALIELILLGIIAFSLWGPKNLVMSMSERYVGEISLDSFQERLMRINMKAMFWITAFHILLVLYSAEFMSDEAWAFISGGLFYIFFALYFAILWTVNNLKNRKLRKEEWFPVVDKDGKVTGMAPRSVCHDGKSKLLHPVVHLHLFDKDGRLFLQKRSAMKDIQPGMWDTSVGGHIAPGEKLEDALDREIHEEVGLKGLTTRFLYKYVWESQREKELVFSFITVTDNKPVIDRVEIDEGKFWAIDEIRNNIGKYIFTPNFEHEFGKLERELSNLTPESFKSRNKGRV